jgi:hypothetical protein
MKNQSKANQVPTKIEIGVYWYQDENGKVHYDFEEMANEFEDKLSQLDPSVVVMCSIESN